MPRYAEIRNEDYKPVARILKVGRETDTSKYGDCYTQTLTLKGTQERYCLRTQRRADIRTGRTLHARLRLLRPLVQVSVGIYAAQYQAP